MTTLQQVIDDTKEHLLGSSREQLNRLSANVSSGATSLPFTYELGGIAAGVYLSVGLELFYVWSVDKLAKTATVGGAQRGTTAAAHTSGDVVTVAPKYSDYAILRRVNDELADLSSPANGLYRVKTTTFTFLTNQIGYNLPADCQRVLEVRRDTTSTANEYPLVRDWRVMREMPTGDFSTGMGIRLNDAPQSGVIVSVAYAAAFTALAAVADDVLAVSGLPASAHDILSVGAAMRLMAGREIARNTGDGQGDPRRAEEVPPGAVGNSYRGLAMLRASRIEAEAARLIAQWPLGG